MKKKLMQYIGCLALVLVMGGIVFSQEVKAASAEIEISTDESEVSVGDNVNVSVIISSSEKFSNFEANLIYNDDVLEYEGQVGVITGDGGFIRIYDMNYPEGAIKRKYSLKFKVLKAGYGTIEFRDRAMVYSQETEDEMSVSSNKLSIKAVNKPTSSDNAFLGKLEVNPSSITPSFDKNVYNYEMDVTYDVDRLIVYAIPADEKSTVSVSGNNELQEGQNKIVISVLAESGNVIEYTIDVNKENAPEETVVIEEPTVVNQESKFDIVSEHDKKYILYQGLYEIIEPNNTIVIPEGFVKGSFTISNETITAYYPEKDMENEFILIYGKSQLGEEGFYRFDRVEKTLQRYVPVTIEPQIVQVIDDTKDAIIKDYQIKLRNFGIAIASISFVGILLIITNVFQFMKRKGFIK